jgi:23S rRNA (adenine1618-N6)-methyltransferase
VSKKEKSATKRKSGHKMHPRNRNLERYQIPALVTCLPELGAYVQPSKTGEDTIDFSSPNAVKLLNRALILNDYGLQAWNFPDANLCPPVPGRADYLHHMADLLRENQFGNIPRGPELHVLDVGVGATAIYPIVGIVEYGWSFVGCDIAKESLESVRTIVEANASLQGLLKVREQTDPSCILRGVISESDRFTFTMCNPPFHASAEEAAQGTMRKTKNLSGGRASNPMLNFSGVHEELIYDGGEMRFIQTLIRESQNYATNVFWFTTMVSKQSHLKVLYATLKTVRPDEIRTIPMGTGNKSTRILAWTFVPKEERKQWRC